MAVLNTLALTAALMGMAVTALAGETYRGIPIAPEHRCAPYDRADYPYPQSVEPRIIERLGGIYGPYTGRWFTHRTQTDIEHMVATSEAHDSGLCDASPSTRRDFARDLLNLTLASPEVNRAQKSARDVADWTPALNRCWFAQRTLDVRRKYRLTIDRREALAVEALLSGCQSTRMVVTRHDAPAPSRPRDSGTGAGDAPSRWDDNDNGRITCAEARRHGIAPVRRGHPAYRYMDDRDRDGTVCE